MATTTNPNLVFKTTGDLDCSHLVSPNIWVFTLSICLVVGILASYLPQHFKIARHGTSAGLSPWWVLLGTLSSTFAIANIIVLPSSQNDMACCREISAFACAAALLGVVQIGVQWASFTTIMILFLVFFPRGAIEHPEEPHTPDTPKKLDAIIVGVTSLFAMLVVGIVSVAFLVSDPDRLLSWANVLGVGAGIVSCVQYIPQLWTTWRLKQVLSLSIASMCIQVPGAFIFVLSLWLRVGWQGWSTWAVYGLTGVMQGVLLAMALSFRSNDKAIEDNDHARTATEEDPLLPANGNARN